MEGSRIHTWEDLAAAFYKQYQYNADLAPTRVQLQNMTIGSNESFKGYAQKWRDLDGRVQPPLTDRELIDIFMGTLMGSFFNYLIGSSSVRFTELILIGKRVENGIKRGKIQGATSSDTQKKTYNGKKESNVVYGQKVRNKSNHNQSVGAVLISNPASVRQQQQGN